jgi:hypothetical protein
MRFNHLLATVTILASGACASSASPTPGVSLPITRVGASGLGHGLQRPATLVVRDRDAWLSVWVQLFGSDTALPPPLLEIDFTTEMVVVFALGAQPSSGYEARIVSATETSGVVTVEAEHVSPARNCGTLTVITYPTDVVRMPRREGTVQFEIRPRTASC